MAEIEERTAEIAGTQVFLREAARQTAAPVLYLHGVPTSGADWIPFLERTGGIAPDLPGFGRSAKSGGFDYSIPGYAEFLAALVEDLGLERLSMVVHDWGGVGLALAQERPALVDRLVVIDCVPLLPGYRWHRTARIWRTPIAGELLMGSTTRFTARRAMRMSGALPENVVDDWVDKAWLAHFDHGTQRAILRLTGARAGRRAAGRAPRACFGGLGRPRPVPADEVRSRVWRGARRSRARRDRRERRALAVAQPPRTRR